jgi:hypothetical protein
MRPGVGPADPATVARAFLDALGAGSAAEAVMRRAWDAAQLLTVERQAPLALPSGKLRPVHAPSRRG